MQWTLLASPRREVLIPHQAICISERILEGTGAAFQIRCTATCLCLKPLSTSTQNDIPIPIRMRNVLLVPLIIVLFIVTTPWYFPVYTHLTLVVTIPIFGILTRYRAHYAPRTSTISPDDEANLKKTSPKQAEVQMNSMLAVARRVVQLEGWAGLWRGWGKSKFLFVPRYSVDPLKYNMCL